MRSFYEVSTAFHLIFAVDNPDQLPGLAVFLIFADLKNAKKLAHIVFLLNSVITWLPVVDIQNIFKYCLQLNLDSLFKTLFWTIYANERPAYLTNVNHLRPKLTKDGELIERHS